MGECAFPGDCQASRTCYVKGCRGAQCSAASTAYKREYRRRAQRPDAIPRSAYVPTGQVRTHIAELRAAGLGCARIAELAHTSENVVYRIATGRQATVAPETKDRILGVMPSMVAPHALVDAGPTLARLEELSDAGWSDDELAQVVLGPVRARDATWQMRRLRARALVTRKVEDAVRRLHDDEFPAVEDDTDPLAAWMYEDDGAAWREDAECRRLSGELSARNRLFFPTRGEPGQANDARAVCERCPVAEPCLDFALRTDTRGGGMWGATTGGERRLIRRLGWTAAETFAAAMEHEKFSLIEVLESALARLACAS